MRSSKLFFLFLFLSLTLFAKTNIAYQQILIAKTSKIQNVYRIKKRLSLLKIGIVVKKSNHKYLIYSKKIGNPKYTHYLLRKIKRFFPYARVLTRYKQQKIKTIKNNKHNNTIKRSSVIKQQKKNDFFIDLSVGITTISGETSDYLASKINNNDKTYSLETGYYIDNNIFLTLTYLNSFTTDIKLDSLYMTFNYQHNLLNNINGYVGGILGVSLLRFDPSLQASTSKSFAIGWQFGIKYNIYNSIDLFTGYEGIKIDHKADIKTTEYINLTYIHNLDFGVIYKF